jgi:hypothetical protein
MTGYLQWACGLLLCVAAGCGDGPTRGAHTGTTLQDAPAKEIDFPELVKIAERYGLPFPPKDAPSVIANTGWTSVIGSSSTSHDPGIYRPAFLLDRLSQGRARVLMGWEEKVIESRADYLPATRPYSLVRPKPALRGYLLCCNNLSSFVTAIQLAQRGATADATKLWDQVKTAKFFDDENMVDGEGELTAHPRELLAYCLYQHLYHSTLAGRANLQPLHDKLVMLRGEFPSLFSDDARDHYRHLRTEFVRDLGLTIVPEERPKDSIEALLIEWGDRTGGLPHLGFFDEHNVERDWPAREIFRRGAKAIPDLERLIGDQRLTRHVSPAMMMKPETRLRLGQLAENLLAEMAGERDTKALENLAKDPDSERVFFEGAAVTSKSGTITDFHEVPLWILGQRHPQSLLVICTKVPSKADVNVLLFSLVNAITRAKLTRQEKTDALASLCERLADYRRQRFVLQRLAELDEKRCLSLLRPILAELPTDVDEPYWTCEVAHYAHVIMQLHDDSIWKDYLRIAKLAAVGLRMEMMNPMNYSYIGDANRQRRLDFLAAFLDDVTVRDLTSSSNRYEGPCAAFTFPRIQVRDFATEKIASLLECDDRPTEFWTDDDWARLRSKVRTSLAGKSPN